MELEVGIYVRTNYGLIGKIFEKYKGVANRIVYKVNNSSCDDYTNVFDFEIINASHNIIDLIEVGDYVNGVEIEQIIDEKLWFDASDMRECCIESNQIKSIVTKEQFENMSYKVGE